MKVRWRGLVAGLALTSALAACGGDLPAPHSAGGNAPASEFCAEGSIKAMGSSAQANAINIWIKNYQATCPNATIEYESIGSGAGLQAFIAGTGDFAGSDSPFPPADQPKADARCKSGPAIHLPMVVGPIALAYNIAGVTGLRLKPATVARIFAGTVTTWNDPAIAADNPDAVLPSTRILTVHRSDSSGTTDAFTKFLTMTAPSDWTFGSDKNWQAPGGRAERGNSGVSASLTKVDGAIGYVEWSYAWSHNLETARIGNAAKEFVELSNDAVGRTIANAKITGRDNDLKLGIDYATTAAGAYPLVLVTYEVVCERGTPPASVALVKGFLSYTSSKAGQAAVTRLGYAPLPEEVRGKVATIVGGLT